jgi:predicted outer membrane repeat protein
MHLLHPCALHLADVEFKNCVASWGGAIYSFDAPLTCTRCSFHDNKAYDGGAVSIEGDTSIFKTNAFMTFTDSLFHSNQAMPTGAGPYPDAYGGALSSITSGSFVIERTLLRNNRAEGLGGAISCDSCSTLHVSTLVGEGYQDGQTWPWVLLNWQQSCIAQNGLLGVGSRRELLSHACARRLLGRTNNLRGRRASPSPSRFSTASSLTMLLAQVSWGSLFLLAEPQCEAPQAGARLTSRSYPAPFSTSKATRGPVLADRRLGSAGNAPQQREAGRVLLLRKPPRPPPPSLTSH